MVFTKLHGIGNDFIIIDALSQAPAGLDDPGRLAKKMCRRHFGIGADGLILAAPSGVADARMRIFNADGGEPEMCGNGIRCLGKFLYDEGLVPRESMTIETGAGVLDLTIIPEGGVCRAVTVDMGIPRMAPEEVPVDAPANEITLDIDGTPLHFFCVSMGNPHAVTYDLYPGNDRFYRLGAMLEKHPIFPKKANIEFCRLNPEGGVDVRVWERGDGPTLACGTGACAVVAAGASMGLIPRKAAVHLPGGDLQIDWTASGHITMTGPAERVFRGEWV